MESFYPKPTVSPNRIALNPLWPLLARALPSTPIASWRGIEYRCWTTNRCCLPTSAQTQTANRRDFVTPTNSTKQTQSHYKRIDGNKNLAHYSLLVILLRQHRFLITL